MGKCISLILLSLSMLLAGCASSSYKQARVRDALDIITLTTGYGGGAKVMAGPLHGGLFMSFDRFGIRGGLTSRDWKERNLSDQYEWDGFPLPLGPLAPIPSRYPLIFGVATIANRTTPDYWLLDYTIPFIAWPKPHLLPKIGYRSAHEQIIHVDQKPVGNAYSHLTQIEIAAGLVGTMRLGINPGEALDFLLGWMSIDLYGDDKSVGPQPQDGNAQ